MTVTTPIAWMVRRTHAGGGYTNTLHTTLWDAQEHAKDSDNLPTPDRIIPLVDGTAPTLPAPVPAPVAEVKP